MVEEVQAGGAPTKQAEHWKAPEIVESALKYTALTFRKTFDIIIIIFIIVIFIYSWYNVVK